MNEELPPLPAPAFPKMYYCNKCGKFPPAALHLDCQYEAVTDGTGDKFSADQMRAYARAALAAAQPSQEPVAHCALTASGKIAYFDGKPMVMVGKVGNEHHPTPLYTTPPAPQPLTLSDQQIITVGRDAFGIDPTFDGRLMTFARAILAEAQEPKP